VKSRYWEHTHKYGILLPKSVKDALRIINKETGTDFWQRAIVELEMKAIDCTFEFRDENKKVPGNSKVSAEYKHINCCHVIFNVKVTLDRKANYVAGGHQTEALKDIMFASVISRDRIRIALTVAALNDLEVLSADISGAYLNAKVAEKVYTTVGMTKRGVQF
jgi:hypothetical protein